MVLKSLLFCGLAGVVLRLPATLAANGVGDMPGSAVMGIELAGLVDGLVDFGSRDRSTMTTGANRRAGGAVVLDSGQ
jgi:hypothetical protein